VARDYDNSVAVNGTNVDLGHERVLLVYNDKGMVALRAGSTQYWAEEAKAPEIEEVPMEIRVPAVGTPVRFEKLLISPDEELAIECSYSYKEAGNE